MVKGSGLTNTFFLNTQKCPRFQKKSQLGRKKGFEGKNLMPGTFMFIEFHSCIPLLQSRPGHRLWLFFEHSRTPPEFRLRTTTSSTSPVFGLFSTPVQSNCAWFLPSTVIHKSEFIYVVDGTGSPYLWCSSHVHF